MQYKSQWIKGLIPTEVNEFFLDFDLFPDLNDNWLLVAEIDRSDEKIDQRDSYHKFVHTCKQDLLECSQKVPVTLIHGFVSTFK